MFVIGERLYAHPVASLYDHQVTSDCGGQHWTIPGTNLNTVSSYKKFT
jgi:hypothetical protein